MVLEGTWACICGGGVGGRPILGDDQDNACPARDGEIVVRPMPPRPSSRLMGCRFSKMSSEPSYRTATTMA